MRDLVYAGYSTAGSWLAIDALSKIYLVLVSVLRWVGDWWEFNTASIVVESADLVFKPILVTSHDSVVLY
jgi:hypothetical protein